MVIKRVNVNGRDFCDAVTCACKEQCQALLAHMHYTQAKDQSSDGNNSQSPPKGGQSQSGDLEVKVSVACNLFKVVKTSHLPS